MCERCSQDVRLCVIRPCPPFSWRRLAVAVDQVPVNNCVARSEIAVIAQIEHVARQACNLGENMKTQAKFDEEELEILQAYEEGKLKPLSDMDAELKLHKEAAEATIKKIPLLNATLIILINENLQSVISCKPIAN
jgi:hypothetical protein